MKFGLSSLELRVLSALASGGSKPIVGVARVLGRSKSVASRVVKSLVQKGFLQAVRLGKRKEAGFAVTQHARAFKELIAVNSHANVELALSYSGLRVLCGLLYLPSSVEEVARLSNTPVVTVRRVLTRLLNYGFIVRLKPGAYRIVLPNLSEFVQAYAAYFLDSLRNSVSGSLFCYGLHGLLRTTEVNVPNFMVLTGVSVFHNYGVSIIQTDYRDYYFNAFVEKPRKLSIEEVVVHALARAVLVKSSREVSYSMLVVYKNLENLNQELFFKTAREFGVLENAQQCLKLVKEFKAGVRWQESLVEPSVLDLHPSWLDFEELVAKYA